MTDTEYFEKTLEYLQVPSTYWKGKTLEYQFFFRSLLQKIDSCLEFQGLPKGWANDFFMLCLWCRGYVAVFKSSRFSKDDTGLVFQPCNVYGYDFYYQPTNAIVANPRFEKDMKIGSECEILKLLPDAYYRGGVLDIIDHYATLLAEASKGVFMGLVNAKVPMILSANNDAQAETLKKVYDKAQTGETLIIWQNIDGSDEVIPRKDPFESWTNNFKDTYIVSSLIDDMQKILNNFYNEIGLPTTVDKKERLVTSEADFSERQSQARIQCWVTTLNESFDRINELFGTNMEVDYVRQDDSMGDGTVPQEQKQINR